MAAQTAAAPGGGGAPSTSAAPGGGGKGEGEGGGGGGPAPAALPAGPTVVLVVGMAGSGKTTFIQRLNADLHAKGKPPYLVNLDPAVAKLPYEAHIDIRDSVDYRALMAENKLGPNGGILTAVNLFATSFNQVVDLCEQRRGTTDYIVVDTAGQIEIFTWSASGTIFAESLASTFRTVVAFVVDTASCKAPQVFMSNMLQACSVLYKTKLPMVLVFNKVDMASHGPCLEWMADFEAFHDAIEEDGSYAASLSRSLSMVLEEFYANLRPVGLSAAVGLHIDSFYTAVAEAGEDYCRDYWTELQRRRGERERLLAAQRAGEAAKLKADLAGGGNANLRAKVREKLAQGGGSGE